MRAPLSIILPTLDAAPVLPGALAALMEGLEAGLIRELIVSDGGSRDETAEIACAAGARLLTGAPGRGGQLRRGAQAAEGDWLLFLHADSWPAPGWAAAVAAHMRRAPDRAAAFRLSFRARGAGARLTAGWANMRSRLFHLPYGDQSLLIPRALYEQTGGFDDIPLMEDVAMARALGRRLCLLDHPVSTDASRYLAQGWMRRGARNWLTLARYLAGTDPAMLARHYRRK